MRVVKSKVEVEARPKPYATLNEIFLAVARYRLIHPQTIAKDLQALKIKPLGTVKQCPQIFPANAAERVLKRRGIETR